MSVRNVESSLIVLANHVCRLKPGEFLSLHEHPHALLEVLFMVVLNFPAAFFKHYIFTVVGDLVRESYSVL